MEKKGKPHNSGGPAKGFGTILDFDSAFPVLYAACYALIALAVHLLFFPIGDVGVETDFYGDLVVAAQEIWKGNFSVENYPYKGPIYSIALAFVHIFGGDWYRNAIVLNAICAAIGLIVMYRLLLRIFNRLVACFSMISVSLVVEFFLQAHKASSDMLFFLFCFLAIGLILSDRLSWWRIAGGAFMSASAFLTRYNGIFLPVSTLVALLFLNPWNEPRKRRIAACLVYLAVFFVACAPWFAANIIEKGSLLANRNLENVVEEFYSGADAARMPEGGFSSLGGLFLHDPVYFIKHYLANIPVHFWLDIVHTVLFIPGFFVLFGFLRLLFVPPTRRQWAFYVYAAGVFLVGCALFHIPRFSIPVTPAYFAIGYSLIFGSGEATHSRLGKAGERTFAKQLRWLKKDFAGIRHIRLSPGRIAAALVIAAVLVFQIAALSSYERWYFSVRPLFVFDAAKFLRAHHAAIGGDRPVIMARKPHIAYYADFTFHPYPQVLSSSADYLSFALKHNVSYIVYSDIERKYSPESEFLPKLESIPGLTKIYDKPQITIYRLEDRLNVRKEGGKQTLAALQSRFSEARESNEHVATIEIGSEIARIFAVNGDWAGVEKCLLICHGAAEQIPDPATANRYFYFIMRGLSQAHRKLGKHEEGIALLEKYREYFERHGDSAQLANIHFQLSNHYKDLGAEEKALDHLRESHKLYVSSGDAENAEAVQAIIEALQED